jgi:subtilisin-like proprotein convertase family protein
VFLEAGVDPNSFAAANGLEVLLALRNDANAFLMSAASVQAAEAFASQQPPGVRFVGLNLPTQYVRMFYPNDPYFPVDGGGVGQPGQWHLENQLVPGPSNAGQDVNVVPAWASNWTGAGVIIGIVDDSFEPIHEDLAPNYVGADSWDFGQNDSDPSPVHTSDRHGISVAGVSAARGGNGLGVTGAAPFAGLAGLRVDFVNQTTAMFVDATLFHSSGANTSIDIKNHSYGIASPYINSTLESAALSTSAGAGTIHVLSAGNERGTSGQDSNKKDLQNHPGAITVAALGTDGVFASYSSFGANVFVTAPSSDTLGITTTDRSGAPGYNGHPDNNYTDDFGGTSSAAPLVAGILALAKEAQPNLDTRFAKHLLVRTSVIVDANDSTASGGGDDVTPGSAWKTNGAGFAFNQNYGFGLIDATALVQEAVNYSGVTPLQTFSSGTITVGAAIPDNSLTGITDTFNVTETSLLEEVLVTLSITHTFRGDIEALLTSPMGTTSRLAIRSGSDSADNINNWQYLSNAFWGEDPFGLWSLTVRDVFAADTGTWSNWSLDLNMGTLVLVPEPSTGLLVFAGAVLLLGRRRVPG